VPTAFARIETDRPSRYLVQLCRHADNMDRARHRPPSGNTGGRKPPKVRHVDFSDTRGIIQFADGQCTLQATADTLTIRVETADEETLRRLQDGIASRLERIGRRDGLAVTWQRPQASTVSPGEPAPDAPHAPPTGAGKRRKLGRLGTTALVIGGALVVALHLGLGGGALATSAWTGWATNIVLALILLKLLVVAGHVALGGFVVRRDRLVHTLRKLRHPRPEATSTAAPPVTDRAGSGAGPAGPIAADRDPVQQG
jgi:hypothetical protein